jgi:predicted transport protein
LLEDGLIVHALTSFLQKVSGPVEFKINCLFIEFKTDFKFVDLLLENAGQNIIDFQKYDKCREVHGLVNDAFNIILWCGEYDEHDGEAGQEGHTQTKYGL